MPGVPNAICGKCGAEFVASDTERTPCPSCGSTGPRTRQVQLSAALHFKGALGIVVHRKPIRRRHVIGYAITFLLAVVGFVVGILVHSVLAAAIIALVILILGVAANELWGLEVHHHHEHFHDL